MVNIARIVTHLTWLPGRVSRVFPQRSLLAIEQAIQASEAQHLGEIRFVVEGALDGAPLFKGQTARERAVDLFSHLRVWDTEHNTGLLIYLLLADHAVEIVADRGIAGRVDAAQWGHVCQHMESAFKRSEFEAGVLAGLQAVTRHLVTHFPSAGGESNDLPDKPLLL